VRRTQRPDLGTVQVDAFDPSLLDEN